MAKIRLVNMMLYGFHGTYEYERELGQKFYFDVEAVTKDDGVIENDESNDNVHSTAIYATVKETVEKAAMEVQQETPLGAYAVEFITSSSQQQRGYYEISIQIGYRRTTEQIQSVVNATSAEAVYSLLESALDAGRTELAVRISYWGSDSREKVETAVAQLRKDRAVTDASVWLVNTYPATGAVGLLEFILEPTEEDLAEAAETTKPEVGGTEETSGVPEEEK